MDDLQFNRQAHNKISTKYSKRHEEIYNDIEQERLKKSLELAISNIKKNNDMKYAALDFGCGAGNLTSHLVKWENIKVTAVDIADDFLSIIKNQYEDVETRVINGKDLSNFQDDFFDFVGTYSVLHHIPDYLNSVKEMTRVTKSGGVIYIDHETPDSYWRNPVGVETFKKKAMCLKGKINKYFRPRNYINKLISMFINAKYSEEGDIHVFADDNISWCEIKKMLVDNGCEIINYTEFLLYNKSYKNQIYSQYKDSLSDMAFLIARKK